MAGRRKITKGLDIGPALRAAAKKLTDEDENLKRSTDITLPPGTKADEPGAGLLRASEQKSKPAATNKMDKLRNDFDALKPSAKRGEVSLGKESKFWPYIKKLYAKDSGNKKLDLEVVKEKLLARDAEGMNVGGVQTQTQTRKQTKAKKAYKKYVKDMKNPKTRRKGKSAKRRAIANNIMSAAQGGLASFYKLRK